MPRGSATATAAAAGAASAAAAAVRVFKADVAVCRRFFHELGEDKSNKAGINI